MLDHHQRFGAYGLLVLLGAVVLLRLASVTGSQGIEISLDSVAVTGDEGLTTFQIGGGQALDIEIIGNDGIVHIRGEAASVNLHTRKTLLDRLRAFLGLGDGVGDVFIEIDNPTGADGRVILSGNSVSTVWLNGEKITDGQSPAD